MVNDSKSGIFKISPGFSQKNEKVIVDIYYYGISRYDRHDGGA